jgi:hypothetical protein
MKCKCGGSTSITRINITHRGKKYQPICYTCKECSREFYLTRIYIPVKGRSLRGKPND